MLNANKTVRMADKRAMVDAILRCAALSQWFTQDLEETQFDARPATPHGDSRGSEARCAPTQVNAIRLWLHRTRKSEAEILNRYQIVPLEELGKETAGRLLLRLMEIGRQTPGQPGRRLRCQLGGRLSYATRSGAQSHGRPPPIPRCVLGPLHALPSVRPLRAAQTLRVTFLQFGGATIQHPAHRG
jgi:hypothetical protein